MSSHPAYSGAPYHYNDIAVLQLERKVEISKLVVPVKLPRVQQIRRIQESESWTLQVSKEFTDKLNVMLNRCIK